MLIFLTFLFLDVYQVSKGKTCVPSDMTRWKTLEDAKEKCNQDEYCSMFEDSCGDERGFRSCQSGSSEIDDWKPTLGTGICTPNLYNRGK